MEYNALAGCMNHQKLCLAVFIGLIGLALCFPTALSFSQRKPQSATLVSNEKPRDYPVKPVPFTSVHFHDSFWAPRLEINRKVTIPFAFKKDEETKRIYNFERAAAALRGEELADKTPPGYPFDDTDVYKVIEGASYALSVQPDPQLDAYLDDLIVKISAAQEADGYLYTTRTIDPTHPHQWRARNVGNWRRLTATSFTTWVTFMRQR